MIVFFCKGLRNKYFTGIKSAPMSFLTRTGTDSRLVLMSRATRVSEKLILIGPFSPCHVTLRTPMRCTIVFESSARQIDLLHIHWLITRSDCAAMCDVFPESTIMTSGVESLSLSVRTMVARCSFFGLRLLDFLLRGLGEGSSSKSPFSDGPSPPFLRAFRRFLDWLG